MQRFLAYLDVWERHITAIEDPAIREVALGGPDTTTRKQTVWQVKLFPVPADTHCLSPLQAWEQAVAPGDGRLSARARHPEEDDNLCLVPPDAGFTGLENQLYRVEIQQSGEAGEATFKWDRDNGSITLPIEAFLDGQFTNRIRLGSAGKADLRALNPSKDLLEITDDRRELNGELGILRRFQFEGTDPATGVILLNEEIERLSLDHHPKVRRWSVGEEIEEITVSVNTFIPLENGVEVRFEGNQFRTGDYWLIPARTATRDVEWPIQDGEPLFQPPLGTEHHYARLALLEFGDGDFRIVADCRHIFPPLAESAVKLVAVETEIDDRLLPNNGVVSAANLARGLRIRFSAPLASEVIDLGTPGASGTEMHPAFVVKLHLPYPVNADDREFWGLGDGEIVGFQPTALAARVSFDDDRQDVVRWRPEDPTTSFLVRMFSRLDIVDRVLCTLRIDGNCVWANGPDGKQVFLDGETTRDPTRSGGLRLPSGDGRRGGIFSMWFWLASEQPPQLVLSAEGEVNAVSGSVRDPSGSAISGATITLTRLRSTTPGAGLVPVKRTTTTDNEGMFRFTEVVAGRYRVTAALAGSFDADEVEVRNPSTPITPIPPVIGIFNPADFPGRTLDEIGGIGLARRDLLEARGITHPAEIASLEEPTLLVEILGISENQATTIIENARGLLSE